MAKLCEVLKKKIELGETRETYRLGWGPNGSESYDVIQAWKLYLQDMYGETVYITLDVTDDASPVIIGLDAKINTTTDKLSPPPTMTMKRLTDRNQRTLKTYISYGVTLKAKLTLLVVSARMSTDILGEATRTQRIRELTLAK